MMPVVCDMWYEAVIGWGEAVVAARRVIALVGGRRSAPGGCRDRSIAHRTGEPRRAGRDYSGLPQQTFGRRRGADAGGEPADGDPVYGARRRIRGVGGAGRPRPARARGDDYGGGQNLAGRAGLGETEAIRLSAPAVDDPPVGGAGARSRAGCRPPEPGAPGPGTVGKILAAHAVKPHKSLPS